MDKANDDGVTSLFEAAENGLGKVVEALIKGGCDVDKANDDGTTPLCMAAEKGHGKVVEALIKGGFDVDKARIYRQKPGYIDTPLYIAAENGQRKAVEALLKAGCDTCSVPSTGDRMRGYFVKHHEQQQRKMLAMAGWLQARLGAGSSCRGLTIICSR